jgi:hypothetical protein
MSTGPDEPLRYLVFAAPPRAGSPNTRLAGLGAITPAVGRWT